MSSELRNRLLVVWRRAMHSALGAPYQSDVELLLAEHSLTDIQGRSWSEAKGGL